jgi:N-acetylglucosamine-6-sulfatase
MHGKSFVPLLKDPASPWRKSFLGEYFLEKVGPRIQDWQAVRTDRWKYIHYTTLDGMDELYDLQTDPDEWKNLIADPDSQPALQDLKGELKRLLNETKGGKGE